MPSSTISRGVEPLADEALGEGAPLQQLHDQQRRPLPGLHAEDRGEVGVGDRRGGPRLAAQPQDVLAGDLAQGLDRRVAAEREVEPAVDHAHAAGADPPLEAELPRQDVGHDRRLELLAAGAAEDGVGGVEGAALRALLGELGHRRDGGLGSAHRRSGGGGHPLDLQLEHPGGVAGDGVQELAVLLEERQAALLLAEPDHAEQRPVAGQDRHQQAEAAVGQPLPLFQGELAKGRVGTFEVDLQRCAGVREGERELGGGVQAPRPVAGVDEEPRAGVEREEGDPVEMEREVDLPGDQGGQARGVADGADALDQQGQDVAGVELLAEEAPVDGVEERLAVAQRRRPDQDGRDRAAAPASRRRARRPASRDVTRHRGRARPGARRRAPSPSSGQGGTAGPGGRSAGRRARGGRARRRGW